MRIKAACQRHQRLIKGMFASAPSLLSPLDLPEESLRTLLLDCSSAGWRCIINETEPLGRLLEGLLFPLQGVSTEMGFPNEAFFDLLCVY